MGSSTAESVKKLAQEHHIPVIEHQALKHYPESEHFSLNQTTREELVAVVMNMPSNKSPGMDKVTTKVIKDCFVLYLLFPSL